MVRGLSVARSFAGPLLAWLLEKAASRRLSSVKRREACLKAIGAV